MDYNVQNLEYAVSVFYNGEANERSQAHQWLSTAQRCPQAWSFVWELLQCDKKTEVQFFAATTLHTKLLRCWNEIPQDSYEELKNKILLTVLAYSNGPKIVMNRLCISLAAFIMQQGSANIVDILRPLSSEDNVSLLLEVLTVIPEEFNSMTMGSVLRTKNRTALQSVCPAVLDDMLRHLQSVYSYTDSKSAPTEEMVEGWCKASTCAASWLTLGGEEHSVREHGTCANLAECLPLCDALLHVVHVCYMTFDTVSDSALEACESALGAVRAAGAAPDACRYPNAALQLLTSLAALTRPIMTRDNVPNSHNEELLAALVTCAVAIGETHSQALVRAISEPIPHEGCKEFIENLLATQAAPGLYPMQETRSQLVFGFWYTLQDEVLSFLENTNKGNELWKAVFTRLLNILIEKSEMTADALSRDDSEMWRCYRQDISDTAMYCYGVLGENCWSIAESSCRNATNDSRREATLHITLSLADEAPRHLHTALLHMITYAVQVAMTVRSNIRLLNTALECLGAYATWLSHLEGAEKDSDKSLAHEALQAAGNALQDAPQTAALALKKLTAECTELAAPLAREITLAAQSPRARSDAWVRRQLLGAAGAALSASAPNVATPLMFELATSLYKDLHEEGTNLSSSSGNAEACTALLVALNQQTDLASHLLKTLLPALPLYASNPDLIPKMFHIFQQGISVVMDKCLPYIEDMAQLTEQAFNTYPCPIGLDVVRLIVIMFDNQWSGCGSLLHLCIKASARVCVEDASAHNDITEALFSTLQTITKKKPHYINKLDDLMPQLVELGCNSIRLWEAGAARAACGWLSVLALEWPAVMRSHAPGLAAAAVTCIGGATPRNQVEPLAELLLSLNRAEWGAGAGEGDDLGHWLRLALAPPHFPTPHANHHHKQKFISAVLKEKSSKRRLLESVQEFSLACRGLIGTEYARETLASRQLVT